MPVVLKICWGYWENASRDKRELSAYREAGYETIVMAAGNSKDCGRLGSIDGFPVYFYSLKPFGDNCPIRINQIISLLKWSRYAKRFKPDVISGHDFTGWMIGWMSVMFRHKKPEFIYDSHEFEIGRNTKRSKLRSSIIQKIERFILGKSKFSIVVNESIADEIQRAYKLSQRPIVIRNMPNYWDIDNSVCREVRVSFLKQINKNLETEYDGKKKDGSEIGKNEVTPDFLVMYHGAIVPDRGIESLLSVVSRNPNISALVLGNGQEKYRDHLFGIVKELDIEKRVIFHEAVPLKELWKYLGAVDLSYSMIVGHSQSYFLSLPNKFFESIQSLTPIIASNFPEMTRVVDSYEIGLVCDPEDVEAINACVEKFRADKEFYDKCKQNLKIAKEELCWEKESVKLKDAISQYLCNQ
ncbi:MAG: glycosyltransferase [Clostridiales bacterium]|nr:glycosyltransferase [Clostridiales bacterium]